MSAKSRARGLSRAFLLVLAGAAGLSAPAAAAPNIHRPPPLPRADIVVPARIGNPYGGGVSECVLIERYSTDGPGRHGFTQDVCYTD